MARDKEMISGLIRGGLIYCNNLYYNYTNMRNIVNISLPDEMAKIVKREVSKGHYATTSEFFRHLLRLWNTRKLAEDLKKDKKEFEDGRGNLLRSLRDLR